MIYRPNEIAEVKELLKQAGYGRAADIIDDLQYALKKYEDFSGYLMIHNMLPVGSNEELAEFWNRPQDKNNTRCWDSSKE